MKSIEVIRAELNGIRYYYSKQEKFEKAFNYIGKNEIINIVEEYNRIICKADPRLYELYICLYVSNHTQEAAAEELGYSLDYIVKGKKKLFRFFYDEMNKEVN